MDLGLDSNKNHGIMWKLTKLRRGAYERLGKYILWLLAFLAMNKV